MNIIHKKAVSQPASQHDTNKRVRRIMRADDEQHERMTISIVNHRTVTHRRPTDTLWQRVLPHGQRHATAVVAAGLRSSSIENGSRVGYNHISSLTGANPSYMVGTFSYAASGYFAAHIRFQQSEDQTKHQLPYVILYIL
eukprot:GHVU01220996.1.p1 GENE.GHVU01220996.1~~GHVU01220996.1.p1  ORF type:complete len:140 (-),score=4.54 GHVU01220996.1:209-628(-)